MTLDDTEWLCSYQFNQHWLFLALLERKRAILKTFSNYLTFSDDLNFFTWFKWAHTFILSNNPWLCYLCIPLFTFVYLCSNDTSMHKFCACCNKSWNMGLKLPQESFGDKGAYGRTDTKTVWRKDTQTHSLNHLSKWSLRNHEMSNIWF